MKSASHRFMFITAATLALSVSAAYGQQKLVANIPFDFTVNGTTLPAGQYSVYPGTERSSGPVLTMYNVQSRKSVIAIGRNRTYEASSSSRLTFGCRASGCALKQIWQAGVGSLEMPAPKMTAGEQERLATVYFTTKQVAD